MNKLIKILDKLYLSFSVIIIIILSFFLYKNISILNDQEESYQKAHKEYNLLKKIDNEIKKISKNFDEGVKLDPFSKWKSLERVKEKHEKRIKLIQKEIFIRKHLKLDTNTENKRIFDVIRSYLFFSSDVNNKKEFTLENPCFEFDGSLQKLSGEYDTCWNKIDSFKNVSKKELIEGYTKNVSYFFLAILILFLFRKWIIWLSN